jgi:hypothetical protein
MTATGTLVLLLPFLLSLAGGATMPRMLCLVTSLLALLLNPMAPLCPGWSA